MSQVAEPHNKEVLLSRKKLMGMLRSFHYAAHSDLITEKTRGLLHDKDVPAMEAWAEFWYRWVAAAYVKHYLAYSARSDYLPEKTEQIRMFWTSTLSCSSCRASFSFSTVGASR